MSVDTYTKYERGIDLLKQRLGPDHVRYSELLVFEQRLSENINRARLYGNTGTLDHDLAQIIKELNSLATELFTQTFNDLCADAIQPHGQLQSAHATYALSSAIVDLLTQICTTSGYHIIFAEAGFGKTALMSYLSQRRRPETVIYTFTRVQGRRSVDMALESLREQLRSRGNLTSAHNYSLAELIQKVRIQPWSVARRRNWPQLLILLDGLDECDHSERVLFHELLPAQIPDNVGIVVTMRPVVHEAINAHFDRIHPFRQSARIYHLQPLSVDDIRRMLFEQYHIYAEPTLCKKIETLSAGLPAAVVSLCRSLEEAMRMEHDPDDVLKQIPPLDNFHDLFDHELDQMDYRCTFEHEKQLLHNILATLAVARQSLQLEQLADVLDAPPVSIQALAQRLDRFRRYTGDGSLAFSHPQFAEYLLDRADWQVTLATMRKRWDEWTASQTSTQPLSTAFVSRLLYHLMPLLREHSRVNCLGWGELFESSIRSREDWIAAITQAWNTVEHALTQPLEAAPSGCRTEDVLAYALLITSWPHGRHALPPPRDPSPDEEYRILLTDQLRDSTGSPGPVETRDFAALMGLLAGDADGKGQSPEAFVLLVSELGQSWLRASAHPQREFAQILRLITQFARRQATVSPLPSPRANVLDALSALAPAIRYHFPDSVEPICYLVDTIIEIFP
ncbi:NACHT domain-containing protein [Chloroflexales bacterium ZM16-3]|nr:NACHT domain-containing protein [Chloroflexales bacterium ZM16-3]